MKGFNFNLGPRPINFSWPDKGLDQIGRTQDRPDMWQKVANLLLKLFFGALPKWPWARHWLITCCFLVHRQLVKNRTELDLDQVDRLVFLANNMRLAGAIWLAYQSCLSLSATSEFFPGVCDLMFSSQEAFFILILFFIIVPLWFRHINHALLLIQIFMTTLLKDVTVMHVTRR